MRLLIHGRLVLGGSAKGSAGLTIYDACAAVLAILAEDWSKTSFTFNPKGTQELYRALGLPFVTVGDGENLAPPANLAEDQLAEFRAALSGDNPQTE